MSRRPRRPLSPEAAAVVRALPGSPVTRRGLLAGAGALGAGAFVAACGTGTSTTGGTADVKPAAAVDRSDTEKIVNWSNWTAYLDKDDENKTYPTLEGFSKKSGIKATYAEDIEDNDSYFGKIQGQLKNGQDFGKDVIVFTDYMAARVIRQGYAQKFDDAVMPNKANILDTLANVDYDKGRHYSLTWQSGYAGLGWNRKLLKEITGKDTLENVSDLWDPKLKGRIEVLSEFRDTIGLIMLEHGVDISAVSWGGPEFTKAMNEFSTQLDSGQIRSVKGNSYIEDLKAGDAVAVIGWSGDVLAANLEAKAEKYGFALPTTGGTLWSDNMLIPVGSPHKKNAEMLMNYYYDPKVAAEVAAYVNYICPVKGAVDHIDEFDDTGQLKKSSYIFPTAGDLAKMHVFRTLTPVEEATYTGAFQKKLGV